jgi:hypothetical protein
MGHPAYASLPWEFVDDPVPSFEALFLPQDI